MDDLAAINRKLTEAREEYQRAKVTHSVAMDASAEIGNPEVIKALRHAQLLIDSALEKYEEALKALCAYRSGP